MTAFALVQASLQKRALAVEEALNLLLPGEHAFPGLIHEAMRYSALGGGKRLRGVLVMEAAHLAGADDTWHAAADRPSETAELSRAQMKRVGALRATAAAVEMVHAYSLIHDDLPCMDDDDMRRGKPSSHRVFGEGIAVLAGDALLTRAFEVISRLAWTGLDQGKAGEIVVELVGAAGTGGLIGGQVADLVSEGRLSERASEANSEPMELPQPSELLSYIHSRKTGALFRACVRMGGILGGATGESLDRLGQYADAFGLAFQIVDDLLDVEGEESALGKQVGSDERKGKLTFPALHGIAEAWALAGQQIDTAKACLAPFGERAEFLTGMADFVLRRRN